MNVSVNYLLTTLNEKLIKKKKDPEGKTEVDGRIAVPHDQSKQRDRRE